MFTGPESLRPIHVDIEDEPHTLYDVVIAVKEKAQDLTEAVSTNIADTWQQVKTTVCLVMSTSLPIIKAFGI